MLQSASCSLHRAVNLRNSVLCFLSMIECLTLQIKIDRSLTDSSAPTLLQCRPANQCGGCRVNQGQSGTWNLCRLTCDRWPILFNASRFRERQSKPLAHQRP